MRIQFGVLAALFVCGAGLAAADDKPQQSPEAMQELFMKLAQPGKPHEGFKSLVGEWDCTCRTFEAGPDNPSETKGKAKFTLILGGRFLQQDMQCTMHGMNFEGRGVTGYDNAQQKYVGNWMDNFGTAIVQTEGKLDEKSGVMTEVGKMHTPAGPIEMRMVSQHKSDDEFLFTLYMTSPQGGGGEQKTMEILYQRKK